MRFTNKISDLSLSIIYEETTCDWEFVFEALMNFLTMDVFMTEISHNFEMTTKVSLFQK